MIIHHLIIHKITLGVSNSNTGPVISHVPIFEMNLTELRMKLDENHPITYHVPPRTFFENTLMYS
jgi:hypothetical protein